LQQFNYRIVSKIRDKGPKAYVAIAQLNNTLYEDCILAFRFAKEEDSQNFQLFISKYQHITDDVIDHNPNNNIKVLSVNSPSIPLQIQNLLISNKSNSACQLNNPSPYANLVNYVNNNHNNRDIYYYHTKNDNNQNYLGFPINNAGHVGAPPVGYVAPSMSMQTNHPNLQNNNNNYVCHQQQISLPCYNFMNYNNSNNSSNSNPQYESQNHQNHGQPSILSPTYINLSQQQQQISLSHSSELRSQVQMTSQSSYIYQKYDNVIDNANRNDCNQSMLTVANLELHNKFLPPQSRDVKELIYSQLEYFRMCNIDPELYSMQ
jgi:hypothetical protein